MKKRDLLILALLTACLLWAYSADRQQRALSDKLIRLHVVANSDSDEDQSVKLAVRDAVLGELEPAMTGAATRQQAESVIQRRIDSITQAADDELARQGSKYRATVTLTEEPFPTRYYDTFTLPAGRYMSLRVKIGAGEGHNWWCVVFPPLCAAQSVEDTAEAVFSPEETELITSDGGEVVVKLKTLEIIANVREWFASLGEK